MPVHLTKGGRVNLSKEAPQLKRVLVGLGWKTSQSGTPYDIDASVFMLGSNGKIPHEEYFVFYNNLRSRDGSVIHSGDNRQGGVSEDAEVIRVELPKVDPAITELVFVVTIDGALEKNQSFGQVRDAFIRVVDEDTNRELARFSLSDDSSTETALEFGKLYRKDGDWRFQAVGQGYRSGLQGFVDRYYQEHSTSSAGAPPPSAPVVVAPPPPVVSLTPHVPLPPKVSLLKQKVEVTLARKNLTGVKARVGLSMDITGSMTQLYKNGTVQNVVERILAVALSFDDDGSLDVWRFDHRFKRLAPATVHNFEGYVNREALSDRDIYGHNDEPLVMRDIVHKYVVEEPGPIPAFIVFVSDGGVKKNQEIQEIITNAAQYPIFWQFVGIGNAKFGALERIDTLPGRIVDNASFFALNDIARISDEELYDRLLNEFPLWLAAVRSKGIVRN
ncbi:MAG: VWA domain-containing protein [Acidobacteria bacterium]|nr:VWA domain-containing protein [Acidobacteriota bacterium]